MKVLYIAHTSDNEGSSVALINIAKGMQGRDIEFAVVCPDSKGALVASLHAMGLCPKIPIHRLLCLSADKESSALA